MSDQFLPDQQWPEMHPDDVIDRFEELYAQYPFYGAMIGAATTLVNEIGLRPNHIWLEDDEALYVEYRRGLRDLTLVFSMDGEPTQAVGFDGDEREFTDIAIENVQAIKDYLDP